MLGNTPTLVYYHAPYTQHALYDNHTSPLYPPPRYPHPISSKKHPMKHMQRWFSQRENNQFYINLKSGSPTMNICLVQSNISPRKWASPESLTWLHCPYCQSGSGISAYVYKKLPKTKGKVFSEKQQVCVNVVWTFKHAYEHIPCIVSDYTAV